MFCWQGDVEIVRLFLENCSHLDHTGAGSLTALHLACLSGQLEVTQALAQRGANIEARDAVSFSPLHIACLYGNETVRIYLFDWKQFWYEEYLKCTYYITDYSNIWNVGSMNWMVPDSHHCVLGGGVLTVPGSWCQHLRISWGPAPAPSGWPGWLQDSADAAQEGCPRLVPEAPVWFVWSGYIDGCINCYLEKNDIQVNV